MVNPFTMLGLPERFELPLAEIDARYREISRAQHPDRFAQETPAVRREAAAKALEVTAAYRALRDPITRAEALLALRGVGMDDQADPAFLFEMMELREGLSAARAQENLDAVRGLERRVQTLLAETEKRFGIAFSTQEMASARDAAMRMRYFRRFLDEASAFEEALSERN